LHDFEGGELSMNRIAPDIRYALRRLGNERSFALVVSLTLALGLGVNATVFGMLDAMLLRPFPFADYQRLAVLWESPWEGSEQDLVAPFNYLEWRLQAKSFERLEAWEAWDATLTGGEEPERIYGFHVSPGFFELLGVEPAVGRTFTSDEGRMGNHRRVVLGDGIWKRRFASHLKIVGSKILIGGEPYTVVGIAPPGFEFPLGAEVWSPLALTPEREADGANRTLVVAGKLAAGRTLAEAQEEMDVISRRLDGQFPETNRDRRAVPSYLVGRLPGGLLRSSFRDPPGGRWNRAPRRRREHRRTGSRARRRPAARAGASHRARREPGSHPPTDRPREHRAGARRFPGGAVDGFARPGILRTSMPAEMARHIEGWNNLRMNGRLMVVTPVVAIGVGLAVGGIAAIGACRTGLSEAFKGRTTLGSIEQQRGRKLLVVAEIAIALSLLIAAGLAVEGSRRIANQPGGSASVTLAR
jgi:putative ABC transport system permease protein